MEREDDAQLVHAVLAGDDAAFDILVERHQKSIHALVWRKIGDFHYAEEITQDTFLLAYQKLSTLRNPSQFLGWVSVIANRLCLKWLHKQKPERQLQSLEDTPVQEVAESDYAHYVSEQRETEATEQRFEIVKKLLEKLSARERTTMTLHYLGEMTMKEISRSLGVSVATVKVRLSRARKRLREEEELLIQEVLGLEVPFANTPFDTTNIPEPVPPPAAVRDFFQLDPYYQQWINVRGFPVLASAEVSPYTAKEVAWTIGHMVGHRPDILKAMAQNRARFSIVPHNKHLPDIPEYDSGRLNFFWEVRARGVDGKITISPEENIICGDRNYCYAEVIHEFAHQVHDYGLGNSGIQGVDPTFDRRLNTLYNMAKKEGLYQNRYAGSNRMEYWAEGVGSWFNGPNRNSNVAHTRSALKEYDPRLAKLLTEVYGDSDWRYTPPATRIHLPHLQGFNPEEAPIYQRPARLLKLEAQLRDPNSDGDGKWMNLELHPSSQLRNLKASATRGDRTDFIVVNLTGTDLSLYFFNVDGTKTLQQHSTTEDALHVMTQVGVIWLIQDHTGKDLVVFRAEEQVGRVLIGGLPSQDVLDVNDDDIADLLDLTSIASRYGRPGQIQQAST